jgi:hypothetical protein
VSLFSATTCVQLCVVRSFTTLTGFIVETQRADVDRVEYHSGVFRSSCEHVYDMLNRLQEKLNNPSSDDPFEPEIAAVRRMSLLVRTI